MISGVPSVSSVHVELDGSLPSTVGRTDVTTKVQGIQNTDLSEIEKVSPYFGNRHVRGQKFIT